jgi:hypothetical protein
MHERTPPDPAAQAGRAELQPQNALELSCVGTGLSPVQAGRSPASTRANRARAKLYNRGLA